MKPLAFVLVPLLVLAGCAAPAPRSGGGMMDEMCKHRAAEPGRAASGPDSMMDKHCKARAEAPAGAASHVH